MSEDYYRLYVNHEDTPVIAQIRASDESGYDQEHFIDSEKYETKEQAGIALAELRSLAGIPCVASRYPTLQKLKDAARRKRERKECTLKHDGHLDNYDLLDGHAEVWQTSEGIAIHVHGTKRDTSLDASQALSLHAYLTEVRTVLEQVAKEQKLP